MEPKQSSLFLGWEADSPGKAQRCLERELLAAAGCGESHLHVSTLSGDLLSRGAWHRSLTGESIWHRHTGGRAIAAGRGFLVVTLVLPHRSALVASEPHALRPEQVLNRFVRGLLEALRQIGLDPSYPGLDFLTVGSQRLAHLSFGEKASGETLCQAVLARETSLAETVFRLDHYDPEGRIPAMMWSPDQATTLTTLGRTEEARANPEEALSWIADAFATTFALETKPAPREARRHLRENFSVEVEAPQAPGPPPHGIVRTEGTIGQVLAWVRMEGSNFTKVGLEGDILAPEGVDERLEHAFRGQPAHSATVDRIIGEIFDGNSAYILGLELNELRALFIRALEAAS